MTTFWKVGMGSFVVGAMIGLIWINMPSGCPAMAPWYVQVKMAISNMFREVF